MSPIRNSNFVDAYDAKMRFSELLQMAESGKEITITKHGTPVARIVPVKKKHSVRQRWEAIKRIQKMQRSLWLGDLKIRDLINEGRP